jgi:hypothetical protein
MVEVKKRTIVIASVLKPVDDARMFEKLGLSLSETTRYDVHIIGFPARFESMPMLQFHPVKAFRRLSFRRLATPWIILGKIFKIKPDILIITTHELIYQALLVRMFSGAKIIYDIQENYFRNIIYTSAYPGLIRALLAAYVRGKENIASVFFNHFFLAEKAYASEFFFTRHRHTVLENKLKKPLLNVPRGKIGKHPISLVFTGTIAETTGVFLAIEVAIKMQAVDPTTSLTLIGYCSQKKLLQKIRNTIQPYNFIKLIGGETLVPHVQIIEAIKSATAGIISYPFNKSTYNSYPTKLFEYLGYKLPIILIRHPRWVELCAEFNAAVVFDPKHIHSKEIIDELRTKKFYNQEPEDVYWESEQAKLLRILQFMLA